MRSKSYIFCFIVLIAVFLLSYTAGLYYGKDSAPKKEQVNTANIKTETESKKDNIVDSTESKLEGYWIKAMNNHIVIYSGDGAVLSNTEIAIDNFTESEKSILKEGIYVETAQKLFRYLESYTS